MSVLCDCAAISTNSTTFSVEKTLSKKLLTLVLKVVYKTPEIEYLHYALQIINHALKVHDLRRLICSENLRSDNAVGEDGEVLVVTYHTFLKSTVEKQAEVISIDKLSKKVIRQRREIESWASAV